MVNLRFKFNIKTFVRSKIKMSILTMANFHKINIFFCSKCVSSIKSYRNDLERFEKIRQTRVLEALYSGSI